MYEKKHAYKHTYKCMKRTHTNVWKKHVQMYEKTRIQMYEKKQAYDKNAYKIAYKCMKKTHTNTHTYV